ncbi:hypothetical protein HK097_009253 [Rhizophlyctis rosea]|uniref:DUF4604 domain-containing protein n=1 Tax=Rhizophlyctis rosea TaxID=64517 RepID=A0AAD5SKS3_9FUNG|nr:hypothetical protein HK097_009253 [Rhizophlyctis rosea]
MSGQKLNYNARQGLTFSADTPNFLKVLQGVAEQTGQKRRTIEDKFQPNEEDEGPDAPEADDEKPQFVVEKGITETEVQDFLQTDGDPTTSKRRADSLDGETSGGADRQRGKAVVAKSNLKTESTSAEKKRKLDEKKKKALAGTKKIKNKTLLSFDDGDA